MSTSNFYANHPTIWALETTDDEYMDEITLEDTQENIIAGLKAIATISVDREDESDDELRSYPGRYFASASIKGKDDDALYVVTSLVYRSGYYSGVNFDYSTRVYSAYCGEYLELDELDADYVQMCYAGYNQRISKARAEQKIRGLEQHARRLEKHVEAVLNKSVESYRVTARFSNGETIYSKV